MVEAAVRSRREKARTATTKGKVKPARSGGGRWR
jgi:hypothetical protein